MSEPIHSKCITNATATNGNETNFQFSYVVFYKSSIMTFSHKLFWKIELNLLLTHSTVWNIYTTNGRLNETHFYFLQDSSLKLQTSSNISVFWVMLKHLFVCFLFLTVSETIKCNIYYVFKTLERIQRLANIVRMTTRCCHLVERIWVKQLKWILRWIRKKKEKKITDIFISASCKI